MTRHKDGPHRPDDARAKRVILAYGAKPARWPAGDRAPVRAALEADRALLAQRIAEGALDSTLDGLPDFDVPPDLARKIAARARREPVLPAWQAWLAMDFLKPVPAMVPASAFAAAVALGVLAGANNHANRSDSAQVADAFVSLAFGPMVESAEPAIHSGVTQ